MNIGNGWDEILKCELEKPYISNLEIFLKHEYVSSVVFPKKENIFNALKLTKFENVKVVILGQDPYHGEGQAHGLAFSVQDSTKFPPSLENIFKEIEADFYLKIKRDGDLTRWARQGVLLLNTVLTVRKGEPYSHKDKGWEVFTDAIISKLNKSSKKIVFLFWGAHAQGKEKLITNSNHIILKAPHPSPLSSYRGFFGCKHFSKANDFLLATSQEPINWS